MGIIPVSEPESALVRRATQIDDQRKEQQTDNRDDLDTGENELGFAVNGDGEDVEAHNHDQDDRDPRCWCDRRVPELNHNGRGRDFGAERQSVRVPVVPAGCETQRSVDVTSAILWHGAGER